jgi:RNA-directed DNA polymerase
LNKAKPYSIPSSSVELAFKYVKENQGAAGVDGESIKEFEERLEDNLYKIWNRMSSGTYFPPPVRTVIIPKKGGGERRLGIPTVGDRVAQAVVKLHLEPKVEPIFHPNSYGYRPNRSQHEAIKIARERCWRYDWVIDLDIKQFFDNLDHELLMEQVRHHAQSRWIELYVERWLKAPITEPDGTVTHKEGKGSPQGSVVSPLLANIFMHHAFDEWMKENNPNNPFERYADDVIAHCQSREEAQALLQRITERLRSWKLEVNPNKTQIVYCKDDKRKGSHEHEGFTFLGYEFKQRKAKSKYGVWMNFGPATSDSALKRMREKMRAWRIGRRSDLSITDIANEINPETRGWIAYYGKFHRSSLYAPLNSINEILVRWLCRKYKRCRNSPNRARQWLRKVFNSYPNLFAHWQIAKPRDWVTRAV